MKSSFWPSILAAGKRVGKTSIHTWWLKWSADMARKRVASEFAEAFNRGSGKEILEIETAITGLANIAILESLRQELDGDKSVVTEKVSKLVDLHRKLQSSSARREAERRAAGRIERRAYANARAEIAEILKNQPEAMNLVLAAIDNAQRTAGVESVEGATTEQRIAA